MTKSGPKEKEKKIPALMGGYTQSDRILLSKPFKQYVLASRTAAGLGRCRGGTSRFPSHARPRACRAC